MYTVYLIIYTISILTFANGLFLSPRGISASSLSIFKGAILYKNGKQTSCELALIGMTYAFIAASCFDFDDDNLLNTKSIYQVRVDEGAEGTPVFSANIYPSDIHIHPDFDHLTMANNIAVVEFYKSLDSKYKSLVAVGGIHDGTQDLYVRRGYAELNKKWVVPKVVTESADDANCGKNSDLYSANPDWMLCTSQGAPSVMNGACKVGFGVVYRLTGTKASLSAIYSHSVVYGTDACGGNSERYDYYTRLEKYVGFAAKALNRPIDAAYTTGVGTYSDKDVLSMKNPSFEELSGTIILSGDLYGSNPIVKAPEKATSSTLTKPSTAAKPTPANGSNSNSGNDDANANVDINSSTSNGSTRASTRTSSSTSSSTSSNTSSSESIVSDSSATDIDNNGSESSTAAKDSMDDSDSEADSKNTGAKATDSTDPRSYDKDNDKSDPTPGTQSSDDSKSQSPLSQSESQSYGKLSRDKAVIIGVSVPMCCVIVFVGAAILYNKWWVKRKDVGVDPYSIRKSQRSDMLDISGTREITPSMLRLGSGHVPSWRESNAFSGNRQHGNLNY